jgi:hypothetical protein
VTQFERKSFFSSFPAVKQQQQSNDLPAVAHCTKTMCKFEKSIVSFLNLFFILLLILADVTLISTQNEFPTSFLQPENAQQTADETASPSSTTTVDPRSVFNWIRNKTQRTWLTDSEELLEESSTGSNNNNKNRREALRAGGKCVTVKQIPSHFHSVHEKLRICIVFYTFVSVTHVTDV